MDKKRILISGSLHRRALEILEGGGAYVSYQPDLGRQKLMQQIGGYQALISRSETAVDRPLLDAGKKLEVVARAAVGVANIDLEYATRKGILVINTPGSNSASAAELTVALMLAAARHLVPAHQHMQQQGWDRHRFSGRELEGRTLGLLGLGNVGSRVARIAGRGLGMRVLAHDPYLSDGVFQRHQVEKCSLEDVLRQAEVLSLHTPLNNETDRLIDAQALAQLPSGAVLINAARGGLVCQKALQAALANGRLAGAGIDTWPKEPPQDNPLRGFPQVVMTPHLGASTQEAQERVAASISEQVLRALRGEVVDFPVNMPRYQVIDDPRTKTYVVLAEKLGSFAVQSLVAELNPHRIEVSYRGELSSEAGVLIRRAFLKGFFGSILEESITFVNAEDVAQRHGISITEQDDPHFSDYPSALKFVIRGRRGSFAIGGVVFGQNNYRISLVDRFQFEVIPAPYMIHMRNIDRPGVIGEIGTLLGSFGVNINQFELSRNRPGDEAMSIFSVDSLPSEDLRKRLREVKHVLACRVIRL